MNASRRPYANPTPLDNCRFNMAKGLWETQPWHWITFTARFVVVAFPTAAELQRGVSAECEE
jgi:hypothetical protein